MKIVFEYDTTDNGATLSTNIQANGSLSADEDVQKGCCEIIKNAALYIDIPACTEILKLLSVIDTDS